MPMAGRNARLAPHPAPPPVIDQRGERTSAENQRALMSWLKVSGLLVSRSRCGYFKPP